MVVPHCSEGHELHVLEQGQARGKVACLFHLAECVDRLEQGDEQGLEQVARADGPCGDAVDAGVEIVQPEMGAPKVIVADEFMGDGLQLVGHRHHVVAVPAHAPADVQQEPVEPLHR